ncbi:MAG: hypothetical protein AAGI37_00845 [Planctomycetota bacterium]
MPSFNYTNRRKLNREHTQIALSPKKDAKDGVRTFTAELSLPDKLHPDALVFIEAYRGSPPARMRFAWGSVANPQPPDDCRLTDFANDTAPPLFRVKVTDVAEKPGRLLANGSQIKPTDPDEAPDTRKGILYTSWGENNGPVWVVSFENIDGPELIIDESADPDHDLPLTKHFKALVYPEIIRQVLARLLFSEEEGGEGELHDDTLGWPKRWLYFPRDAFGFSEPPPDISADRQDRLNWITEAVNHCAKSAGFCGLLAPEEDNEA